MGIDAATAGADDVERLALTWTIPDAFGGMTAALLHRSRTLAAATGRPVQVLTFDPVLDLAEAEARVAERGGLAGVLLRNPFAEARGAGGRVRKARAAGVAVVEHLRADGSVALRDERIGEPGAARRRLVRVDADGHTTGSWDGAWAFYRDWIAELVGDRPAVAVVDSKTMAPFAARLDLASLATVHVVHASHLSGSARPIAPLRRSRWTALSKPERFDAVVFLTERQRTDAEQLLTDAGALRVIPNGRPLPPEPPRDRDRLAGLVVAGLTPRKRVEDAIAAVGLATKQGVAAHLTVIGDGPERARLERLAADGEGEVTFTGHLGDAASRFADASWMLLTSRSEGAPLVLVEAMARGCLPIAYDVPYGPADLIEHGVNGFLVGAGDRGAAAAAIRAIATMPDEQLAAMRSAARATAEAFDDEAVTRRWLQLEREVLAEHTARSQVADGGRAAAAARDTVAVTRPRLRLRHGRLRFTCRLEGSAGEPVVISFRPRGTTRVLRRTAEPADGGRIRVTLDPEATSFLARGRRIEVRLQWGRGAAMIDLRACLQHPDTRSVPRRLADRLRSVLSPRRPRSGGPADAPGSA
ncbi:glycosyltransferase [Agromyces sp. G08B096]|uniref:Glycosyltransferase n=1 Tax=Agromyces sp. G08B096 TaxID=3156399 RepID=A0AAU7W8E4_9MICO